MTGALSFKVVQASVRPHRIAILIDKNDDVWQDTCLRIIEFFSQLWGGAYNIIVPTDGNAIDDRFWTILESFDPDHLYVYRKSGEDVRLSKPEQYERTLDADVRTYLNQFGAGDETIIRKQIDDQLRRARASNFAISNQLQNEIRIRLAPSWFEQWTVEAGAIGAGSGVRFPLTDLTKIILNTKHSDRFASITAPTSISKLWVSSRCGLFNEKTAGKLEQLGIHRDSFDFGEGDLGQLIEFVVTGSIEKPWFTGQNTRIFERLPGTTPFEICMLQIGLYRSTKYPYWNEPLVLVAGNTLEDFCFYFDLSRLRDRVTWVLPSITEKALNRSSDDASQPELSFIAQLRTEEMSNQSQGGLACASHSLTNEQLEAVYGRLNSAPSLALSSAMRRADAIPRLIRFPLTAVESENFQRDIPVQLSDDVSISPFSTPKPKNFHAIHPSEHRYITQLSIAHEAPPKHFRLGSHVITGHAMTTHDVRVGKYGPSYLCPNIAYFGGDIDTVLVRPHLHLPPLHKLIEDIARPEGYQCRPSDKGIYADETIAKWGGLAEAAKFVRDSSKRALLDQFLDRSRSQPGKGVYLDDDRRRYLDFSAIKAHVGRTASDLVDELVSKQILYRGFIFRCSYCRNSTWFSVSEITQEFKCKRCGRQQVYTRDNWKMPDEPAWFYKLDELVYQGYRQGMAVTLLALDYLRLRSSDNFSFSTDREFWKVGSSKADAEVDLFCVSDGVLMIGEAKKEGRLGDSTSEENAEIAKYKRIAAGLSARKLVLATFSDDWSANTRQRATAGFQDMPYVAVEFLARAQLFEPLS